MAWMGWNRESKLPTVEQLEGEMDRVQYQKSYKKALRGTIYALIIVAGVSMLIATLLISVLRIYGDNMNPTINSGEMVVAYKTSHCRKGDVAAFYYNNKILVRRVIALPGETVEINEEGTVYVNGNPLSEPYLEGTSLGQCDIRMPYEVPGDQIFVLGDNRQEAADSRMVAVGCVPQEQMLGKVVLRVWPMEQFGFVK
ncbi:MAG: signal peptidase I [Lachnospiraceae bacterium]|jgi:signal peptidase I|nr:signal peptidase I [Lachnospiraceae bacterium]